MVRLKAIAIAAVVFFSATACFSAKAARAETWLRADTHDFIIYSNGSQSSLTDFAVKLERYDAILRVLLRAPTPDKPYRLKIYLVPSAATVGKLAGDQFVAGFYAPDLYGSFAVANRERAGDESEMSGQITLFHEYAHHMMFNTFASAYPSWYQEGFAEYVATVQVNADGSWSFGYPAMHRAWGLADAPEFDITRMLANAAKANEDMDAFYSYAWLTVHMLNSTPQGVDQLSTYLTEFASGVPAQKAATDAFGDLKAFSRKLQAYKDQPLRYHRSTTPIPAHTDITVTTLDPTASRLAALTLGRLSAEHRDNDTAGLIKSRTALLAFAEQAPNDADAQYQLAQVERMLAERADPDNAPASPGANAGAGTAADSREAHLAAAQAALDRAIAIAPDHVDALVLKASLMLDHPGGDDPAMVKKIRALIIHANHLDPDNPVALYDYYRSYAGLGMTPPQVAIDGLAQAFGTEPEVPELRVAYAFALANQRKFREAEGLLKVIAFDPHGGTDGVANLRNLAEMERRMTGSTPLDAELAALEASGGIPKAGGSAKPGSGG